MHCDRLLFILLLCSFLTSSIGVAAPAAGQQSSTETADESTGDGDALVERWIEEGRAHLAADRPRRAVNAFRRASTLSEGRSVEALFGLAQVALRDERFELAVSTSLEVLELAPPPPDRLKALLILGAAHYELRKDDPDVHLAAAEDALRQAHTLALAAGDPTGAAHYSLAKVLHASGQLPESLELLRSLPYETAPETLAATARELLCTAKGSSRPEDLRPGPFDSRAADVDEPEILPIVPLVYQELLRRGKFELPLEASVELLIDRDGCVAEARFLSGPENLREDLPEIYASKFFHPGQKDGQPVAVWHVEKFVAEESER